MKLTDHDIKQINDTTLEQLSSKQLLSFTKTLLADYKKAKDYINQNSNNSSRPSGSMPPWASNDTPNPPDQGAQDNADDMSPVINHPDENDNHDLSPEDAWLNNVPQASDVNGIQPREQSVTPAIKPDPVKRVAGKQEGAQGYGRTQELAITDIVYHVRIHCASCDACLGGHDEQAAWTAFYTLDIADHILGLAGITVINTKHIFFETKCDCGHHNREEPYAAMPDVNWPKTALAEWRFVGPRFAAMIVLLSKRFRNSRRLIREFLFCFLGIELSVGTIDQTIREAGRSVAPLEEELIHDLEEAALAYVDETSWKEAGVLKWLWVFRTLTVVFFMVGKRDRTIFCKLLLNGRFKGIVMSDGWVVYREYANRLCCWAHLIRKARGLSESNDLAAGQAGLQMLVLLTTFQNAIYAALVLKKGGRVPRSVIVNIVKIHLIKSMMPIY